MEIPGPELWLYRHNFMEISGS